MLLSDFREYYGVDLLDLFRDNGKLSPRVAFQLMVDLPIGSRWRSEQRGGQKFRNWDETRYALTDAANSMRLLVFLYSQTHSKKNLKQPALLPMPLDGKQKKSAETDPSSFAGIVAQAKKRHEQKKQQKEQ